MGGARNKINIVLLTDCLADAQWGGAEKQVFELAQCLNKEKYEVHVVSLDCEGETPVEQLRAAGFLADVFKVRRIYGLSGVIQGIRFFQYLRAHRIDIVVTYHFSSDVWGAIWGRLAGVKTIVSNRRDMGFWRQGIHTQAYRLVSPLVTKIVAVSESVKQAVIKDDGVPSDNIEVIYNGVELTASQGHEAARLQARAKLGVGADDLVIMHVANLKPVKGHEYLLKAVAALASDFKNMKLVLIGEDELDGALQRLASGLGIVDKVKFLGKRRDVRILLACADVCVMTSFSEGMSNAILEYMDAGKPVVATRVGGNPEVVVDEVTGILVPAKDADALAVALRRLLENSELCEQMGSAGRKRVEETFAVQRMVQKYDALFHTS